MAYSQIDVTFIVRKDVVMCVTHSVKSRKAVSLFIIQGADMPCFLLPRAMVIVCHNRHEVDVIGYLNHVVSNVDDFSISRQPDSKRKRRIFVFKCIVEVLLNYIPSHNNPES